MGRREGFPPFSSSIDRRPSELRFHDPPPSRPPHTMPTIPSISTPTHPQEGMVTAAHAVVVGRPEAGRACRRSRLRSGIVSGRTRAAALALLVLVAACVLGRSVAVVAATETLKGRQGAAAAPEGIKASGPGPSSPPRFRRIPSEELERLNHAGNGVVARPGGGSSLQFLPPPFAQEHPKNGQQVNDDGGMGSSEAFDAMGRRADARWEAALGSGGSVRATGGEELGEAFNIAAILHQAQVQGDRLMPEDVRATLPLAALSDQCAAALQTAAAQQKQQRSLQAQQEQQQPPEQAATVAPNHDPDRPNNPNRNKNRAHHPPGGASHARQKERFPPDAAASSADPAAHPPVENPYKGQPRLPLHTHRLPADHHHHRQRQRKPGEHGRKKKGGEKQQGRGGSRNGTIEPRRRLGGWSDDHEVDEAWVAADPSSFLRAHLAWAWTGAAEGLLAVRGRGLQVELDRPPAVVHAAAEVEAREQQQQSQQEQGQDMEEEEPLPPACQRAIDAAQEMQQNGSIPTPPGFSLGPAVHSTSTGAPQSLFLCLNQQQQQGPGQAVAVCAPPVTLARLQAGKAGAGLIRNLAGSGSSDSGSSSICSAALEVISGDGSAVARRQLRFEANGPGPLQPGEARAFELELPPMQNVEAVGFWLANVQFC